MFLAILQCTQPFGKLYANLTDLPVFQGGVILAEQSRHVHRVSLRLPHFNGRRTGYHRNQYDLPGPRLPPNKVNLCLSALSRATICFGVKRSRSVSTSRVGLSVVTIFEYQYGCIFQADGLLYLSVCAVVYLSNESGDGSNIIAALIRIAFRCFIAIPFGISW